MKGQRPSVFLQLLWSKHQIAIHERPHGLEVVGIDGKPHEKVDKEVVHRLAQIFGLSQMSSERRESLHRWEEETKWFGVTRTLSSQSVFQDHGRFAFLMAESQTGEFREQFPRLVSFIGQTGSGKSTIIRMLIEQQRSRKIRKDATDVVGQLPYPIPGIVGDSIPTTGDVHLYSDPSSYSSKFPMLFADCEGLDGGEHIPRALAQMHKGLDTLARSNTRIIRRLRKGVRQQRRITWANSPETQKREYAVEHLYPRLLYTFSDVVVFVLREPRIFETVISERLLYWAEASIDKSLNQPALPHIVIVINATQNQIEDEQWGTETATKKLLDDIKLSINRVARIQALAAKLKQVGKDIDTTEDLLLHYYSSVTVVRIPVKGRYMLIDEQVEKLYDIITGRCNVAYERKKAVRLLFEAERLQTYLTAAYDHFSQNLDRPFDSVKEALKHSPIPRDFGGNILKFALAFRQAQQNGGDDPAKLFDTLTVVLASCIMLDAERQTLNGSYTQLLRDSYSKHLEQALNDYCSLWLPCAFQRNGGRCCNVKSAHGPKGHQRDDGKIIGAGKFQNNFKQDAFYKDWIARIGNDLENLTTEMGEQGRVDGGLPAWLRAANLHRRYMSNFFEDVSEVWQFVNHDTCLWCLRHHLPEFSLPCGHVLYATKWASPFQINLKPQHAGVRILCLDGGGVRGIVELAILKLIEAEFKGHLDIQSFFDLVVGTSAGGIVALGTFAMGWSLDDCIARFERLCSQAFTPRGLKNVPLLGKLVMMSHNSIYKSSPYEEALQSVFGTETLLFGGKKAGTRLNTHVAITSTTQIEQQSVVFTNYNRPRNASEHSLYKFVRSDRPSNEVRVWEAARATSAAPPYFKAFVKEESKSIYIDGALFHNCPVQIAESERRLIWDDANGSPPDILLSVGTGRGQQPSPAASAANSEVKYKEWKRIGFIAKMWRVMAGRFDNILKCERIWEDYVANATYPCKEDPELKHRFIRLNVDISGSIPNLDEIDKLEELKREVTKDKVPRVKEVAHRLIASCFYFDILSFTDNGDSFTYNGTIKCKFCKGSDRLKGLGRFLEDCFRGEFEPHFLLHDENKRSELNIPISRITVDDMRIRGKFCLPVGLRITSKLSAGTGLSICLQQRAYMFHDCYLSISGFPRQLYLDEKIQAAMLAKERPISNEQSEEISTSEPLSSKATSSGVNHKKEKASLFHVEEREVEA
ncbi:hypothetical protein AOQ84DRAFT_220281 [Glonium stellatum]|uniref:PNPLA domain-containing protein n=1 Tax=Glonium stellatum TaxID=574774 RepID=A0A8E2F3F2_9PEZI|nr:hypothetical protein AOQ84DRAFT_220281 [Glonium stellatum]